MIKEAGMRHAENGDEECLNLQNLLIQDKICRGLAQETSCYGGGEIS